MAAQWRDFLYLIVINSGLLENGHCRYLFFHAYYAFLGLAYGMQLDTQSEQLSVLQVIGTSPGRDKFTLIYGWDPDTSLFPFF